MSKTTHKSTQDIVVENIESLLKAKGWLERDFLAAAKGSIKQGTFNRVTTRDRVPKLETVAVIAHVFGLPAWALLVDGLNPLKPPVILTEEQLKVLRDVAGSKPEAEHAEAPPGSLTRNRKSPNQQS